MTNLKTTYLRALPHLADERAYHNPHATQLELAQAFTLYRSVVEILDKEDRLEGQFAPRLYDYCIASIGTSAEEIANEL